MNYFRTIGTDSPIYKWQIWLYNPEHGDVLWRYGLEGKEAQKQTAKYNREWQHAKLVRTGGGLGDWQLIS